MYCPKCGIALNPGASFCSSCGTAVVGASAPAVPVAVIPVEIKRPALITLLGVLTCIGAVLYLLIGGTILATTLASSEKSGVIIAGSLLVGAIGLVMWVCGHGLLKLKPIGRTLTIVLSVIGLFGFPIGTILSILVLVYMFRPGIKLLFSGKPVSEMTAEEAAQIAASSGSQAVLIVVAIVLVVLFVIVAAIIAAIAVPGLLRARLTANEVSATASLRAISSGQSLYASSCAAGGFATSLEDLAKVPGGSSVGFVPAELNRNGVSKAGYRFRLEKLNPSTTVTPAAATCNGAAADAATGFFATAEPEVPGSTGSRYFAIASDGTLWQSQDPISNPPTASSSVTPVP